MHLKHNNFIVKFNLKHLNIQYPQCYRVIAYLQHLLFVRKWDISQINYLD